MNQPLIGMVHFTGSKGTQVTNKYLNMAKTVQKKMVKVVNFLKVDNFET